MPERAPMCSCKGIVGDCGRCDGQCAVIAGMEDRARFAPANANVAAAQAIYAAEWEMRKAVGVLCDFDHPTHKRAVRLLDKWRDLRVETLARD